MTKLLNIDLHNHGPIGYQPYWLKAQGYEGKNLLQLIADTCFEKNMQVCAVTSETHETDDKGKIVINSIHDRFGYLANQIRKLSKYYSAYREGALIHVRKESQEVILVNGQTVIVQESDKRLDHLVIGSNQVPNFMPLEDTLKYGQDNELIQIAEHPFCTAHYGIGQDALETNLNYFDAIEGHNAQMTLPRFMSALPILGKYTKRTNDQTKAFATRYNKPYIATSDAHRIEDTGVACITADATDIDITSGEKLLETLKQTIRKGNFVTQEGYESLTGWLSWVYTFKTGLSKVNKRESLIL